MSDLFAKIRIIKTQFIEWRTLLVFLCITVQHTTYTLQSQGVTTMTVHTLTCINLYSRPPKKKKGKIFSPNSVLIITAKRFQAFRACSVILYAVYFNYNMYQYLLYFSYHCCSAMQWKLCLLISTLKWKPIIKKHQMFF